MSNITLTKVFGGSLTVDAATVTSLTIGVNTASTKINYTGGNAEVLGDMPTTKAVVVAGGVTGTSVTSPFIDSLVTFP